MKVTRDDGEEFSFTARCRIDTYNELEYFRAAASCSTCCGSWRPSDEPD